MIRAWTVVLVSTVLAGCPRKPDERAVGQPAVATLAAVTGDVSHRGAGGLTWASARQGLELREHDSVRTGRASSARVQFRAGGGLELDEQSLVVIEAPVTAPSPAAPRSRSGSGAAPPAAAAPAHVARLEQGTVRGISQPGAPAVMLRTPDGKTAQIVAEGGEAAPFRARVRDGKLEVAVLKGAARVRVEGNEVVVKKQEVVDVSATKISAPAPLPDFPELLSPAVDANVPAGQGVALRWKAVAGARLYRVQASASVGFERPFFDTTVGTPEVTVAKLPVEGTCVWRVSALNAAGREGEYGFARRFFVSRTPASGPASAPARPTAEILWPPDNAGVQYVSAPRPIVFRWKTTAATEFELVISRQKSLKGAVVMRRRVSGTAISISDLGSGFYYWGVYAVTPQGRRPLFDSARRLVVARRLPPGVKVPSTIDWK